MFKKYNFINIICLTAAGIISSVYFYIIGTPLTRYIIPASIIYFIFFILIFLLTGNIQRKNFTFLKNNVFITGEVIILLVFILTSFMLKELDYWNAAGIFILGLIIIFESSSLRENIVRFLFLIVSPVFYTGLLLKHAYFTEVIFFSAFIILAEKLLQHRKSLINYFITAASLGFILLFNPYLVLLYIIFSLYYFRMDLLKRGLPFIAATIVVVLILQYFMRVPFYPEGVGLNYYQMIPLIILSIYAGLITRTIREVIFSAAILITIAVLVKMSSGNYGAVVLLLSTLFPMLIISSGDYKTEKWIGKILTD